MSADKFNKQLTNTLLLEGLGQSTHALIGRAVDNLSPGSSGDEKSRIVLGLVAWENAKGKRVCQQRVRVFSATSVLSCDSEECGPAHGHQGVLQGCNWLSVPPHPLCGVGSG